MTVLNLTNPVAGTEITAGLHSSNNSNLLAVINGGIDSSNISTTANIQPTQIQHLGWTTIFDDNKIDDTSASFDIQSIPATYQNLHLILYGRGTTAATTVGVNLIFNNDSGSNYAYNQVYWAGVSLSNIEGESGAAFPPGLVPGSTAPANRFGAIEVMIPWPANTLNDKTAQSQFSLSRGTSTGDNITGHGMVVWKSTAAINRITVSPASGLWKGYSHCTLLGSNA